MFQFDRKMKDGNVKEKKFLLFFKKLIHKQQTHILAKEFPAVLQNKRMLLLEDILSPLLCKKIGSKWDILISDW